MTVENKPPVKWEYILKDPTFQEQPEEVKLKVATNYFNSVIAQDPTFQQQPQEIQDLVLSRFLDTVRVPQQPEKESFTKKALETAKDITIGTAKETLGYAQALQDLVLGGAGFVAGLASGILDVVSQVEENPKRLIPAGIAEKIGIKPEKIDWGHVEKVFKEVSEAVSTVGGLTLQQPMPNSRQLIDNLISYPFTLYEQGVNELAQKATDDPNKQAMIRMFGRGFLFFAPKIKEGVKSILQKTKSRVMFKEAEKLWDEGQKTGDIGKSMEAVDKANTVLEEEGIITTTPPPEPPKRLEQIKAEAEGKLPDHIERAIKKPRKVPVEVGVATKIKAKEMVAKAVEEGEISSTQPVRFTTVDELKEIISKGKLKEGKDYEGRPGISAQTVQGPLVAYGDNERISAVIIFPEDAVVGKGMQPNEVKIHPDYPVEKLRFAIDGYERLLTFDELKKVIEERGKEKAVEKPKEEPMPEIIPPSEKIQKPVAHWVQLVEKAKDELDTLYVNTFDDRGRLREGVNLDKALNKAYKLRDKIRKLLVRQYHRDYPEGLSLRAISELEGEIADINEIIKDFERARANILQPKPPSEPTPFKGVVYRAITQEPVDEGMHGKGIYYTTDKESAKQYAEATGGKVIEQVIELKRPFMTTSYEIEKLLEDAKLDAMKKEKFSSPAVINELVSRTIRERLEKQGYDGIIVTDANEIVVFHPDQAVKSKPKTKPAPDSITEPTQQKPIAKTEIPEELRPLAEKARRYENAFNFIIHLDESDAEKIVWHPNFTTEKLKRINDEWDSLIEEIRKVEPYWLDGIEDPVLRKKFLELEDQYLKEFDKILADFYNQAVKSQPETKPSPQTELTPETITDKKKKIDFIMSFIPEEYWRDYKIASFPEAIIYLAKKIEGYSDDQALDFAYLYRGPREERAAPSYFSFVERLISKYPELEELKGKELRSSAFQVGFISKDLSNYMKKLEEQSEKIVDNFYNQVIKAKSEAKPTPESIIEPMPQNPIAETEIPEELKPLAEEARKYKSAEEFIKSFKKVYRGSYKEITPEDIKRANFISTTIDRKVAERPQFGGVVTELYIRPDAKIAKFEDVIDKVPEEYRKGYIFDPFANIAVWAKSQGYDALDFSNVEALYGEKEIRILNPKVLMTKSQIIDFYNQAVKSQPEAKLTTEEKIETKVVESHPTIPQSLIPYEEALRAFEGISHVPEKRAQETIHIFYDEINSIYNDLSKYAKTEKQREFLDNAIKSFAEDYAKRYREILHSKSQIASPMIVGPAKFPTSRMNKLIDRLSKKEADLKDWVDKRIKTIKKKIQDIGIEEEGGEIQHLKNEIEKLRKRQETMKEANKIIRSTRLSDTDKKAKLKEIGLSKEEIEKILTPDYMGRIGFKDYDMASIRNKIKTREKRIKELEQKEASKGQGERVIYESEGLRIIENPTIDRYQLLFEEKPDKSIIDELKSHGFKWSPKNKAWQRKITNSARHTIEKYIIPKLNALIEQEIKPSPESGAIVPEQLIEGTKETLRQAKKRIEAFKEVEEPIELPAGIPKETANAIAKAMNYQRMSLARALYNVFGKVLPQAEVMRHPVFRRAYELGKEFTRDFEVNKYRFFNRLRELGKETPKAIRKQLVKYLQMDIEKVPENIRPYVQKWRSYLDEIHGWMTSLGYNLGYRENYLPHIFEGNWWVKIAGDEHPINVRTIEEAIDLAIEEAKKGKQIEFIKPSLPADALDTLITNKKMWALVGRLQEDMTLSPEEIRTILKESAGLKTQPRYKFVSNFLQRKTNNPYYMKNFDELMEIYTYRMVRKAAQDKFLKEYQNLIESAPDKSIREALEDYRSAVLGHPTNLEKLIADVFHMLAGKENAMMPRRGAWYIAGLQYTADLGFMVSSALVNSTQALLNVLPLTGVNAWRKGVLKSFKAMTDRNSAEYRELVNNGIIQEVASGIEMRPYREIFRIPLELFTTVEKFNRATAYFSAKELGPERASKILELFGVPKSANIWRLKGEDFARAFADTFVDYTQFRTEAFNVPHLLRSPIAKLIAPYKTFMINQHVLMFKLLKHAVKDPKPLLYFIALSYLLGGKEANLFTMLSYDATDEALKKVFHRSLEDVTIPVGDKYYIPLGEYLRKGFVAQTGLNIQNALALQNPWEWLKRPDKFFGRVVKIPYYLAIGDVEKAVESAKPRILTKLETAKDILTEGKYYTRKGYLLLDKLSPKDAFMVVLGMMPEKVLKVFDALDKKQEIEDWFKSEVWERLDKEAKLKERGRIDEARKVREELKALRKELIKEREKAKGQYKDEIIVKLRLLGRAMWGRIPENAIKRQRKSVIERERDSILRQYLKKQMGAVAP